MVALGEVPDSTFLKQPRTVTVIGAPMTFGQPLAGTDEGPRMIRDAGACTHACAPTPPCPRPCGALTRQGVALAGLHKVLSKLGWRIEERGECWLSHCAAPRACSCLRPPRLLAQATSSSPRRRPKTRARTRRSWVARQRAASWVRPLRALWCTAACRLSRGEVRLLSGACQRKAGKGSVQVRVRGEDAAGAGWRSLAGHWHHLVRMPCACTLKGRRLMRPPPLRAHDACSPPQWRAQGPAEHGHCVGGRARRPEHARHLA